MRRSSILRGLENDDGSNHCFLNVAIQAFWNLDAFRTRFLAAPYHEHSLEHRPLGATAASQRVVADGCCFCAMKALFSEFQYSEQEALPPDRLRVALSRIYRSQGRFQLGEMEDATETIEVLLDIFHASSVIALEEKAVLAEVGAAPSPEVLFFPAPSPASCSAHGSGSSWEDPRSRAGGATAKGRGDSRRKSGAELVDEAGEFPCQPPCIAHEVFGMEYIDVPRCTFCGCTEEPTVTGSFLLPVYVAELRALQGSGGGGASGVPSAPGGPGASRRGSRQLAAAAGGGASLPSSSPGQSGRPDLHELLWRAHHRSMPQQKCRECNSLNTWVSERWLTRRPHALLLSLIWPSSEPSKEAVRWMLSAVRPILSVDRVFRTQAPHAARTSGAMGTPPAAATGGSAAASSAAAPAAAVDVEYAFCGMICYHGTHYIAIFWCWESMQWILFDDTALHCEHSWSSVTRLIVSSKYIPTLLFHERCDDGEGDGGREASLRELSRQIEEMQDLEQPGCAAM